MSESGSWKIGFWVMTTICGVWLMGLTSGLIANEFRNIDDHKDIRACSIAKFDQVMEKISIMSQDLREMKVRMGIREKKYEVP